jgi:hypothetical protein
MPEVVISKPSGGAGRAEYRIDRRQALPRHRIDDGDFCMIEDRRGKVHAPLGIFRQERKRRHECDDASGDEPPRPNTDLDAYLRLRCPAGQPSQQPYPGDRQAQRRQAHHAACGKSE